MDFVSLMSLSWTELSFKMSPCSCCRAISCVNVLILTINKAEEVLSVIDYQCQTNFRSMIFIAILELTETSGMEENPSESSATLEKCSAVM